MATSTLVGIIMNLILPMPEKEKEEEKENAAKA